jgi:hypothetical protein
MCLLFASLGTMLCVAGCQDAAEVGAIACEGLEGKDRDHCIQQLAVASGNTGMCEDIASVGPKSKCWLYIAAQLKQSRICGVLSDKDWYGKQGAYDEDECLQYVAKETGDPTLCNEIMAGSTQSGSDLNPDGISRDICINSIQCGKTGEKACYNWRTEKYSCSNGNEAMTSSASFICP